MDREAQRKFHSFPVRRRMLSVSSVSLSGDLSREAWANLQRLFVRIHATLGFCLFSFPPESQPWAWETWLNVSLFERKIPQVSQQDTVESKTAERKPAKPCLRVVSRQSILRFCGLKGRCIFLGGGCEPWKKKPTWWSSSRQPAALQRRRVKNAKFLELQVQRVFCVCARMWKRVQRDKKLVSVWYVFAKPQIS